MKFALEHMKDAITDMLPLFEKHWQEIAHFKDIPLDPDLETYYRMQDMGILRVFTARTDQGVMTGYAVYFIKHNLHYRTSLQALQDILFIDPAHRGFGAKFMLWCDEQLKAEGIHVTYHHIKKAHNFGPLLEKMGYELVDLIYARRLN